MTHGRIREKVKEVDVDVETIPSSNNFCSHSFCEKQSDKIDKQDIRKLFKISLHNEDFFSFSTRQLKKKNRKLCRSLWRRVLKMGFDELN